MSPYMVRCLGFAEMYTVKTRTYVGVPVTSYLRSKTNPKNIPFGGRFPELSAYAIGYISNADLLPI